MKTKILIAVIIAVLLLAAAVVLGVLYYRMNRDDIEYRRTKAKYEKELNKLLGEKTEHGELLSCGYSNSGDMNGNVDSAELKRQENGSLILKTQYSPSHDIPIEVKEYRADEDALDKLRTIIDEYNLSAWERLPRSDYFALDAATKRIYMAFDDSASGGSRYESCSVDYDFMLPDKGYDILKKFTDCLFSWETEDRLIRTYTLKED